MEEKDVEEKHIASLIKRSLTSPYAKFVYWKAIFYVVVAFFAASLVFIVVVNMPGNPAETWLSRNPNANPILVAEVYKWFGLDKPLWSRYLTFLGQFLTGNFGPSFYNYPASSSSYILGDLPYTLALAIPVLLVSFLAGNRIGARSAYLKGKWNDAGYFSLVAANQLPPFWFALVLLFLYVMITGGKFPPLGGHYLGDIPSWTWVFFVDVLEHWIMPFVSLLVVYIGGWATGMRSMVTYERDADYVQYGRQLGFKDKKLMAYTERNAILPQFTGLNLVFSAIIGNTMIIEIVFNYPGIGYLLYNSILDLDFPTVFGCFYVVILIVVIGNFIIDILYGFLDPRIRTGQR